MIVLVRRKKTTCTTTETTNKIINISMNDDEGSSVLKVTCMYLKADWLPPKPLGK